MESFSRETIDSICDTYSDDKDLIIQILFYLYHTSTDDKMKSNIVDIFNDMQYCIQCGEKMSIFAWNELHNEVEGYNIEKFAQVMCEICDSSDIYSLKATKVE